MLRVFSYIDLAHAVVDELGHLNQLNIADTQLRWGKTKDGLSSGQTYKALICTNDGKIGSSEILIQIFQHLRYKTGH